MDRQLKGQVAEAYALSYFVENAYSVYIPFQDNGPYDLLVMKNGKIEKVSVKYCDVKYPSGSWKVDLRNISRRANNAVAVTQFDNTKYDLIAVWVAELNQIVVMDAAKATPNILTITVNDIKEFMEV